MSGTPKEDYKEPVAEKQKPEQDSRTDEATQGRENSDESQASAQQEEADSTSPDQGLQTG